jgi:hypothetical protein
MLPVSTLVRLALISGLGPRRFSNSGLIDDPACRSLLFTKESSLTVDFF